MENSINKENEHNYNSILQKINHKPLLVENIFSYIKNEPFKFLHIIEKDKTLKESINSRFFNVKKNNLFSKEINDNISLIIFYKKFIEMFRVFKDEDSKTFQKFYTEKEMVKNKSDPSFILYKTNSLFNRLSNDKSLRNLSFEGLIDIALNEQEKYEHIHLTLLPQNNHNYKDYLYMQKNLKNNNDLDKNNNCMNKVIDTLYCIIDDNEYYLNLNFIINKNITINEIYFIYIKGIKDINKNQAIGKYLDALNKNNIKQITFGYGFYELEIGMDYFNNKDFIKIIINEKIPLMEIINDALINNRTYIFPKSISINLLIEPHHYTIENRLKYFFGIYYLFQGQNINGIFELNSKSYHINMLEKIKNSEINILIIKYNGLSSLDDNNFNKFVKECLNINIPNIIFYIAKDAIDKKKNNEIINFELEKNKNYFVYSEIPTKKLYLDKYIMPFQVIDSNNDIILQEKNNNLLSYLFLLKKYNSSLCFKWNDNENVYYKMYFIKKEYNYDLYILNKSDKSSKYYKEKYASMNFYVYKYKTIDFEEIINYCKDNLNLSINRIIYNDDFPLDWYYLPKNDLENKNKKGGLSKKLFSNKMNQKQILEYEFEDYDYDNDDDEEEENDEFQDDDN